MDSAPEQSPEHWLRDPQKHLYYGLYKGTVEQRTDATRRGRLRVRVVSIHGDGVSVDNLPWALPKTSSWRQGGLFAIPPLDATVWVEFEAGDPEYPVWSGGWWGTDETVHGTGKKPNWFGGEKRTSRTDSLRLDKNVNPDDAPNCFGIVTPIQKHMLLDDRKGLERIRIGDQLENTTWLNSEVVLTLETLLGVRISESKPRGLTISRRDEQVQIYTHYGWRLTFDDKQRMFEVAAPSGAKFRISDTDGARAIQAWTAAGHYASLNDATQQVDVATYGGQRLLLDQAAQVVHLTDGSSMLHMEPQHVILDVVGKLDIRVTGILDVISGGKGRFEGSQLHWNSEATAVTNAGATSSGPANPLRLPATVKAWEASKLEDDKSKSKSTATPVST